MEHKAATLDKALGIAIEGGLTVFRVGELKEAILPAISQCQEIEIDLSQVTEIDAEGLRFLMLAKLEAWRQDRSMHFKDHSVAVTNAIDLCELSVFFGDPVSTVSSAA